MEPESSSPHSQKSATCPYPDPDQGVNTQPSYLFKINFNIILPSTSRFSN
jgi:hypothetical protein